MSVFNARRESARREEPAPELLTEIPVSLIMPNPDQPRKSFDEGSIRELAASIEQTGLIQPLIVRERGDSYELIAGERRLRAVRLLGWRQVKCIINETLREDDAAIMAITENLQREDLHFFEEADCYSQLLKCRGMTQEELALRIGKSQSYIANKLRLLKLEPQLREEIASCGLSERHARELLRLGSEELRSAALERMVEGSLSVKESGALVSRIASEHGRKPVKPKPRIIRIFRDYRVFINTVSAACEQLRDSGLTVSFEQKDIDNGVDITIRVTQNA